MHLNVFVLQPASGAEKEKRALLFGPVIFIDRAASRYKRCRSGWRCVFVLKQTTGPVVDSTKRVQRTQIWAPPIKKKKLPPTLWCTLCICLRRIWVDARLPPLWFITIEQGKKKKRARENKLKPKPAQTSPEGSSEYAEVRCCVYSYANLSPCKSPHIKWILCTRLLNNEPAPFQLFLALSRFAMMWTGLSAGDARARHPLPRVYRNQPESLRKPAANSKNIQYLFNYLKKRHIGSNSGCIISEVRSLWMGKTVQHKSPDT